MDLRLTINPNQANALRDALARAPHPGHDATLPPIWEQLHRYLDHLDDLNAEAALELQAAEAPQLADLLPF